MSARVVVRVVVRLLRVAVSVFALWLPAAAVLAAPCDIKNNADPFVDHDLSVSYCELCGYGYVTVIVTNPYSGATMTNIRVVENLGSSGLTYAATAPTPVRYSINGGPLQPGAAPSVSGTNGSVLTFNLTGISLDSSPGAGNDGDTIAITFAVARATALTDEGLVTANRTIQATVTFNTDSACGDSPQSVSDVLPLREPIPRVFKTGRNVDALQTAYTNPVYGNINDDLIWRIQVQNSGLADLQDLRFDDLMQAGNMVINYACPTAASADAVANNNGVRPGGSPCVNASNTIPDFDVDNPFGNPGNDSPDLVDVRRGSSAFIYLVGKITSSCATSKTNTVSDIQWGCQIDTPAGGITATSTGTTPASAVARLYTLYGERAPLEVERRLTGTNTSQPVGSKGTMTITIRNRTGGTVKNITLRDVLPPEYVMDPTYTPTVRTVHVSPVYGNYPGMTDNIVWTNPVPGTFPLTTTNPTVPLGNTTPEFTLTSTGCSIGPCAAEVHPLYADQRNMLRHGDNLEIVFRVVLVRPASYDRVANLDVREEAPNSDPPGTDPAHQTTLTNTLTVEFDTFCATQPHQTLTFTGNGTATNGSAIPANPEDLDVDISGTELVFILTNNPAQPLTLPVRVTNRGGHDARDWRVFVSFGATMQVQTAPAGCSVIALSGSPPQPAPWKAWILPAPIPATATVYQCTQPAVITPGQTVSLDFTVIKTSDPVRIALDDLSFRADVVGEITLSNGTPLWFPAPIVRADGQLDRANNYSLDAIRARVIGFNLLKSQLGYCTENNSPLPALPDRYVQIGEDCSFHIDTGGWFGFETPGFTYIAVQDIQVFDQLPDGQGYISSTDPYATGTTLGILGISLNPAGLTPLDEGWIDWTFNTVVPGERITVKDEWFRVDMTSRILNDPIDSSAAPNQHAAPSTNVLNSYFQAVFMNENLVPPAEEVFNLGPSTVGYPIEAVRRVSLTVTEPRLLITKAVCNEALYGAGPACSNFVALANNGDARNSYIYRVTLTNEAAASGVTRAPAYDVISTDLLDASDLAYVLPFNADGLDNDGDGLIDAADTDGEGAISDNTVKNGLPAQITFQYTHSNALQRLNAGQTVTLYYRVDFDDDAAPRQQFTNRVSASYDSLTGPSGNQNPPQRPNSDKGGARAYTTATATSTVEIIPVLTQPKTITRLSATPVAPASPQPVAIGEEVEYELVTRLPVALLRNFVIRDQLPAGIRCAEAPVINLNAGEYAAAGFVPGGVITPTCTSNLVEWNFGDQRVTQGTTNNYFDFKVRFIARVDNSATNNSGTLIRNGGTATNVTATYVDQVGSNVTLTFGEAAIVVREPNIVLTKQFAVASADAGDVLTVTVRATNTGNGTAYNLQVLDDLTGKDLTYLGSLGGSDPPDVVDTTTLGANQPIFRWNATNPDFAIAPGATVIFTFQVRVDEAAQPQELLDNTLQARWSSLPGQSTALNSTGLIGPDGSLTGLRNGALPNAGDPINDYETTATASVTVPTVTVTKTELTPETVLPIGAHKHYQIEISLPEGTTNSLIVRDNLAAGSVSYFLTDDAAFGITYEFVGIANINPSGAVPGSFNSYPSNNQSGVVTWDIGTVVTAAEDDTAASNIRPAIRIKYYVRANNDTDTDAGDTLQNVVTLNWTHGETSATQTAAATAPLVTVVEPMPLTLTKMVGNVTPGKLPGDSPVMGDTLEYSLVLQNNGSSTAFDVNLVDNMPTGVELSAAFTPTATISGTPVAGFVPIPAGAPAGPLVWGRGNGDGSLDVPAGSTLVLRYQATVLAVIDPSGLIQNGVLADWTSLEGVSPYERTGAGCPTITAPNDYCLGPVYASVIGLQPVIEFQKMVTNLTTGEVESAGVTVSATPGDRLRYRLTINNLGSSPVTNLSLVDELDRLNGAPMFVPGTLTIVSALPPGVDASNTSATGGAQGTGLLDIRNISFDPSGGANTSLAVDFEVQLALAIADGTTVNNQGQSYLSGLLYSNSDDPFVTSTPPVSDPTPVSISSAPAFQVFKASDDLTGDPAELMPGDTLRYTITVKNVGTENATGVSLRDAIPANTTYVANSTTLNGATQADVSGTSPLVGGLPINAPAPEDTPGFLRADATATTANVATITFDVVINAGVPNATVISNQGFVNGSGAGGPVPEQPSDDPATPAADDPTLDIVGNEPSIYALKTVQLLQDFGTPGIVDVGDVLRYTFTITNSGTKEATGVALADQLPNDTTYANSFLLNGIAVSGAFPPAQPGGVAISSADLTPPLPAPGAGTLSAGGVATVTFNVTVSSMPSTVPPNPSIPTISNQGTITSVELPSLLTDADGDLSNGYQPTQIVVGGYQGLVISKQVTVVGGGAVLVGEQLEYTVTVRNISLLPATNVVITDVVPALLTYVAGSATLNGATGGVSYDGVTRTITADYATTYGDLAPGASAVLRFRATITSGTTGDTITNTADVTWNAGTQNASASVSVDIGGILGSGMLSGRAWHDANHDDVFDSTELALAGWTVQLYRNGTLIVSTPTDVNGQYTIASLVPNFGTANQYELRFLAPGASATTAKLGMADSAFTNDLQRIYNIVVYSGSNLQNLNLPIDPDGVVYNSVLRTPLAGATLDLMRVDVDPIIGESLVAVPASCFGDTAQQGQVTLASGYYRFDINFSDLVQCPSNADYVIQVTPPGGFATGLSVLIPPATSAATTGYSVPACSADAIPGAYCEAQASEFAPALSVPAASPGTVYYLRLTLADSSTPREIDSQLFNNHLPIDPQLGAGTVSLVKTSPLVNVNRGQLVPYTISFRNSLGATLPSVRIVDTMPAGFKYVPGSAQLDGVALEPVQNGRELTWPNLSLASDTQHTLKLLLIVGAGVGDGEYVNQAQAFVGSTTGSAVSPVATATVRVVPDPTFDCTDVIGKVFDDKNANGYQDKGEPGLGGVRVVSARGLIATTDKYGRYHITCAVVPNENRGSNYILKLDERSLPSGYRVTTENPLVKRVTRGKMMKFNFGAGVHRIVRLDISDAVFEPNSTEMRPQWRPRLGILIEELKKAPSVLRLSYLADVEEVELAKRRLDSVKGEIDAKWEDVSGGYVLPVETEIYWRRGGPPDRGGLGHD